MPSDELLAFARQWCGISRALPRNGVPNLDSLSEVAKEQQVVMMISHRHVVVRVGLLPWVVAAEL